MGFGQNLNKYLIIDGDAICYICAKPTEEESIEATDSIINSILSIFKSNSIIVEGYWIILSEKPYFRTRLYPEYKAQRKQEPLPTTAKVKEYLRSRYQAVSFVGFEADDIVIKIKDQIKDKGIVVSTDKDVVKGYQGTWLNYKKMELGYTDEVETLYFFYKQVLMGDAADNIKGCPLIGEKKATKLLDTCLLVQEGKEYNKEEIENCYKSIVYQAYENYYKDKEKAKEMVELNSKLVKLLIDDKDYETLGGYIPSIPSPTIINHR